MTNDLTGSLLKELLRSACQKTICVILAIRV
jgi:hypothetical protein